MLLNGEYTDLMYMLQCFDTPKRECYYEMVCCMSEQLKCGELLLKANWYFLYIPWSTDDI